MTPHFRTTISPQKTKFPIDYQHQIMLIGSCFVENIGKRLSECQFQTLINPQGIVFNPISMAGALERYVFGENVSELELHTHNELWFHYDFHSQFSQLDKSQTLEKMQASFYEAKTFLAQTTHLILTFGTAWVYQRIDKQEIVANCHKVPSRFFQKRLLSVDEIVAQYQTLIPQVMAFCPELQQITFTVSPVRHWKDGAIENQQSKATLLLAIHQIMKQFSQLTAYFPAYEVMMDDLRDYRFYEKDMLHPNEMAIDYIWQLFQQSWLNPVTFEVMEEVQKVNQGLAHRPFQPNSDAYLAHLQKINVKIEHLKKRFPFMRFEAPHSEK